MSLGHPLILMMESNFIAMIQIIIREENVMKRMLVIANTYSQLIMAMQMNLTIAKNDEVVLLLSDHSKGTRNICDQLKKNDIFSEAYYINTKNILALRNKAEIIKDYADVALRNTNRFVTYLNEIKNRFFDELIVYNYGVDIIGLYSILYTINKNIRVSFYEEGVLSYTYCVKPTRNMKRNMVKILRNISGRKDISASFHDFYCFYPKLYKGDLIPVSVPHIFAGDECSLQLKLVFAIDSKTLQYDQKYIFFTSVYDFEGGAPIGEFELVSRIAKIVGKNNLLIKTHPRDTRTIYQASGFSVDANSEVPWEVIQLSKDFSDKVFMTVNSGSVLAGSFMTEKPTKTFYMYKCCDISGNYVAQRTAQDIYDLLYNESVKSVLEKVKIVDSIEEILE